MGFVMRRARILVVDDNRVNRKLLTSILESAGHRVDEAGNGREAVDGVRLFAYDLVLMDVQMPGMDGLEATAAIRALGDGRGGVPIVGITGDVSDEVTARGRAVGMNGQLSKPLNPDVLQRTVELWVDTPAAAKPAAAPGGLVDGLSPEALKSLLGDFEEDARRRLADMQEAVRAGDRRRIQALAHDLGGAAANLGLEELGGAARAIETTSSDGSEASELARMIRDLPVVLAGTMERIAAWRTRLAPADGLRGHDGLRDEPWPKV
jgi:two-component system sensor histidine kinase/response regulator